MSYYNKHNTRYFQMVMYIIAIYKNTSFAHLGFNKCLSVAVHCRRKNRNHPQACADQHISDLCGHFVVTHP